VFDVPSGKERGVLQGHLGDLRALAFTPDGRALAASDVNRTLKVWNPRHARPVAAAGPARPPVAEKPPPKPQPPRDGETVVYKNATLKKVFRGIVHFAADGQEHDAFAQDGTVYLDAAGKQVRGAESQNVLKEGNVVDLKVRHQAVDLVEEVRLVKEG